MKDIARMAGVSPATVSHVLNGTKRISPETERRVREAVRAANYVPNTLAKSLRKGRAQVIGVLAEDLLAQSTPEMLSGIHQALQAQHYVAMVYDLRLSGALGGHTSHAGLYRDAINDGVRRLLAAHVDGILYAAMHDRPLDGLLDPIDRPIAFAGAQVREKPFAACDITDGARIAAQHLIGLGHRRIGVVCGPAHETITMRLFQGFQMAMQQAGLPVEEALIAYTDGSEPSTAAHAQALLAQPQRPTALLAMADTLAFGAMRAAHELGLSVPGQLSLAGIGDAPQAAQYPVPLTSVRLPLRDAGAAAARLLLAHIQLESPATSAVLLPCTLAERASTAAIPLSPDPR